MVNVNRTHAERETFGEREPQRQGVGLTVVDAGEGNGSALAAGIDRLLYANGVIRLQSDRFRYFVQHARDRRAVGLHADGVDATVRAFAVGVMSQFFDHVGGFGEINYFGAVAFAGEGEALGDVIDRENLAGALKAGAEHGHLAYGSAAPHGDALASFNFAVFGGHEAGGEDVGEEEYFFVGESGGHLEQADVGMSHAGVLGLAARVGAVDGGEAVHSGSHGVVIFLLDFAERVGVGAERPLVFLAEFALAAGDGAGGHHPVAFDHFAHGAADFDDLAHEFVAEDVALVHFGDVAVVDVQVGAADGGGGYFDDGVGGVVDFGIGDGFDFDLLRSIPACGFHGCPFDRREVPRKCP